MNLNEKISILNLTVKKKDRADTVTAKIWKSIDIHYQQFKWFFLKSSEKKEKDPSQ